MNILQYYELSELAWIAGVIFLLGMSKGGFPVGSIALPILVLMWPGAVEPAKSAVSFLLPVLCAMDIVAICFYRKHILWSKIMPLLPGTLLGVATASVLFLSQDSAVIALPDKALKLVIGLIGLLFVLYRIARKWILKRLSSSSDPGPGISSLFGLSAGVSSTLAHAAGPLLQMYLLPRKLPKMNFAATIAGFFFILNLVKMVPFSLCGRIETANLYLGACMLPVIPLGVAAGYLAVKKMKSSHYIGFIYTVLFCTSIILIIKALN